MGIKAILFAVTAIAAPGAPNDTPKPSTIDFEVRIVDCDGLAWRGSILPRLSFQGYQGGSSAWVADAEALDALIETLEARADTKVLGAPRIQAAAGTPATFQSWTSRHVVLHAEAVRMASASAFRPIVAPVEDGVRLMLRGQPVARGLKLTLEVEDTRIVAVHQVVSTMRTGSDQAPQVSLVDLQVPEIDRREVAGEWLIPEDHGLVMSLGLQSRPNGENDQTNVRDRLLILVPSSSRLPAPGSADLAVRRTGADARRETGAKPPKPKVPQPNSEAEPTTMPAPAPPMPPAAFGPNGPAIPPPAPRSTPRGIRPEGFELKPTPWGLVPVFPAPPLPEAAERGEDHSSVPRSMVPSRSLPIALLPDGSPAPPSEDDQVVQDAFESFVEGRAVPTPQMSDDAEASEPNARQPLKDRLAKASGARQAPRPSPSGSTAETAVEAAPPPPTTPPSADDDTQKADEAPKRGFRFRIGFRIGVPRARTDEAKANAVETERADKDKDEAPQPSSCPLCGKG